jgi:signal transduction histidine kinase
MPTVSQNIDRSRTLAVAEDAERITWLAQELQRNAAELEGQSHRLRGTIRALESANTELHHKASELASAHSTADGATARLERLQRITAALSDTVTQDAVADSVLTEACIALECDAGAVVVTTQDGGPLMLLREAGDLDPLMRSFVAMVGTAGFGPYAEAIAGSGSIYLESSERMAARYPAFHDAPLSGGRGAWIFLPLEIEHVTVGALAFGFTGPRAFSHAERQFADTVARYCAQALDRVRLRVAAAGALAEARDARILAELATGAQTQFMRGMSHELRTPLNAISGYAALLEDGIRGEINEEQAIDLGRIRRASSYLLRLINDVLTVARLEGVRPLELAAIVVNPVLAEVEGLCAVQAKASGLTLSVRPSERTLVVEADGERLQQILLNLITNAIKFTTPGGSIAVTCEGDAQVVRLTVQDTGVGVPPIDIDRVFEPFVQIDRHLTNSSQQGIGLGLSISRDLARAMRGDLTLTSTVGVGSTFTVTLPAGSPRSLVS